MLPIREQCPFRVVFSWPHEIYCAIEKKVRNLASIVAHLLGSRDNGWHVSSTSTTPSPLLSELRFEKFVIDKNHRIHQVNRQGEEIPLGAREQEVYGTDFFAGSMAISRDPAHTSKKHKTIYTIQSLNVKLFREAGSGFDTNLCHAMIILGSARSTQQYPAHAFSIAHVDCTPGLCTKDYDPLLDDDVDALVVYRPVSDIIRQLYRHYAEKTISVSGVDLRSRVLRTIDGKYSFYDAATAMFRGSVLSSGRQNCVVDREMSRKTAALIADFLLNEPIKNSLGLRRNFICSGYTNAVLQGTIFIRELRKYDESVVRDFLQESGKNLSRKRLIDKICGSLLTENENDPVARTLYQTYQHIALMRLDVCQAMPIYVDRLLCELVD